MRYSPSQNLCNTALGFLTFFGTIFLVLRLTAKHLFDKNLLKATLAIGVFAGSIGLLLNALYIDVYAASKVAFTYWAVVGVTLAVFSLKLTVPKRQQPQALLK